MLHFNPIMISLQIIKKMGFRLLPENPPYTLSVLLDEGIIVSQNTSLV